MSDIIKKATRDGFGDEIVELGRENSDILVVDVDIGKSCKTGAFRKELPAQYLNVGIAEQNAAGVAAGLATCGKIPFVVTYAAFGSMRMVEMIRQENNPIFTWLIKTTLYNESDTEETQAILSAHITSDAMNLDTVPNVGGVYLSPSETLTIWYPFTIPLEPGEYTIELLANDEIKAYTYAIEGTRSTFTVDDLTATEAIEANTTMVYQSGERLIVRTDEPIQVIRLYDRSGRLVRTGDEAELSTAGLPAGIYIVSVETATENKTQKISIQ